METWKAINSVRVVRQFADEPIAPQHLDRILNAGRTGSSKNRQDWAFIVIRDRENLRQLSKAGRYADHLATSSGRGSRWSGPMRGTSTNCAPSCGTFTAPNKPGGRVALDEVVHQERW
jgi:nitroreductase